MISRRLLGVCHLGAGRTRFRVWAPRARRVSVHLPGPQPRVLPLQSEERGYFSAVTEGVHPGSRYLFRLDDSEEFPDPCSLSQPDGPHQPSEVIDEDFPWTDSCWFGLPLEDYLIYELHVGTFTSQGSFKGLIPHLAYLKDLGVTALEMMPVAQFPGERNWGYDGTYPFAPQNSYGGVRGLKQLVDACHQMGLAAVLDVVYNHLGPEGNYLARFGPYFTGAYQTPWGEAVNFDGPWSDEVRRYFLENAFYWLVDCHFDALRLDAVHAIRDFSATPFLAELKASVCEWSNRFNRRMHLISESALNDIRVVRPRELGGWGHDAQWNDDFHHALRTLLVSDRSGYYQDFGKLEQLAKAFREGYVLSGEYSAYRKRRHGNSSKEVPAHQLVVFSQNHDQIGNQMLGERLVSQCGHEGVKLAAAAVILSPFIPLLFMGEEYGETHPFPYFISHTDPDLVQSVREGRRLEFASFRSEGEPPDPQHEATFLSARLRHEARLEAPHAILLNYYRTLTRLRKELPALRNLRKEEMEVRTEERYRMLRVRRWKESDEAVMLFCFSDSTRDGSLDFPAGRWRKLLDSADADWGGPGSRLPVILDSSGELQAELPPCSFALYRRA